MKNKKQRKEKKGRESTFISLTVGSTVDLQFIQFIQYDGEGGRVHGSCQLTVGSMALTLSLITP
jgi:hypothetical protein